MTVVREFNAAGSCIELGELIRETDNFYTYRSKYRGEGEKRISKSRVHTEPCTCCEDHPQTQYPNGNLHL